MKKLFAISLIAVSCAFQALAGGRTTSFGIIVDKATYDACKPAVEAYKAVLEQEGLQVFVLADEWTSPDPIREWVIARASAKKAPLEGIVLVGDVPIVMVKRAQHMTTAFKMDDSGKYPDFSCSVASDRFYDCFGMKFDFDYATDSVFYYKLSPVGSQQVRPDVYSARIKVPAKLEGDKYEHISKYLEKAVAAHKEQDVLDNMTFFAGHGYNSDCLTVWRQKPLVWRENFPYCFKRSSTNRFLDFRSNPEYKWNLMSELQRPGCDYFQFSEHGSPDTQYINGDRNSDGSESDMAALHDYVRRWYRYYKGTEDEEPFCHEVLDSLFHLKRSLLDECGKAYTDSLCALFEVDGNIVLEDLAKVRTNARVVVLNACYNGSFYDPEGYVAGMHVFSDGGCICAQGNTVNVLQDKWEDELVGYLSIGERIGMWQKELPFLESHLIGDPTFRFAAHDKDEAGMCAKLHSDLVFKASDKAVWRTYMKNRNALLRSAGAVHFAALSDASDKEASAVLLSAFKSETSPMVRLHILNSARKFADANRTELLRLAFRDSYETVVRHAVITASASCEPDLIKDIEACVENHPEMLRVAFQAEDAIRVISNRKSPAARISDKESSDARRVSSVRDCRNNRYPDSYGPLLDIAADPSESEALRVSAAEALGWYCFSVCRGDISSRIEGIISKGDLPEALENELRKTVARLAWK